MESWKGCEAVCVYYYACTIVYMQVYVRLERQSNRSDHPGFMSRHVAEVGNANCAFLSQLASENQSSYAKRGGSNGSDCRRLDNRSPDVARHESWVGGCD
jgi:hypothetical protein